MTTGRLWPGSTMVSSQNYGITAGPDGAIWYTGGMGMFGALIRLALDGTFTYFPFCTDIQACGGDTLGAIITGPDGNLWFTSTVNGLVVFKLN
jgi:virginiamycin B lyase